ncbi:hypothetical protein AB0D68_33210 [Streptomyces sp. NPDC048212]|uniref:hypothetical protein n=1 Tax=unclassified Streptomyces TaxID=2593676 RepID=UPI0029AE8D21|nr:hypothetical protein [Streptomyces sp. WI03-5b]MDX2624826.1 hypothetical protein [Streptomyces sp. WI03-5b]
MKQKKPVQLAPDELLAEAVVNEILGTRRFDYDDQSEPGKADFLLDPLDGAGRKVALEVSSTTDPDRQRLWKGLDQYYDEPISGLQGDWTVQFTPGTHVKKTATPLVELLQLLEREGTDKIGLDGWNDSTPPGYLPTPQHAERLRKLASLKIVSAQRIRHDEASGRIFPLEMTGWITRSTADAISRSVNAFLGSGQGANKVKKLARYTDREGHLFVWADRGQFDVTMALRQGFVPGDSPDVPDSLHTIWFGSLQADGSVFRWTRSGWTIAAVTPWASNSSLTDVSAEG